MKKSDSLIIAIIVLVIVFVGFTFANNFQLKLKYAENAWNGYGQPTKIEVKSSTVKGSSDSEGNYHVSGLVDGKPFSETLRTDELPVTKDHITTLYKYKGYTDRNNGKPVYYAMSQGNLKKYSK